jgi:hypothetical protein
MLSFSVLQHGPQLGVGGTHRQDNRLRQIWVDQRNRLAQQLLNMCK